jgi:hypothetical protein
VSGNQGLPRPKGSAPRQLSGRHHAGLPVFRGLPCGSIAAHGSPATLESANEPPATAGEAQIIPNGGVFHVAGRTRPGPPAWPLRGISAG